MGEDNLKLLVLLSRYEKSPNYVKREVIHQLSLKLKKRISNPIFREFYILFEREMAAVPNQARFEILEIASKISDLVYEKPEQKEIIGDLREVLICFI